MANKLRKLGFDEQTILLVMDAWRPSTKKLYTTYLRKWALYCVEHKVSLLKPSLAQVCRFLRVLAQKGLGYGAINATRSALSTILPNIDGQSIGKHPVVCLLVKGVYERRPPGPRYASFWDVNAVLDMFKVWGRTSKLTLKLLTLKLVMLLLLVTSQRGQTVHRLSLEGMDVSETVVFRLQHLLKHNRLGDPLGVLVLKPFDQCFRLCVVRAIKEYLARTGRLRGDERQLLISFVPPHRAVSRDTISRWVMMVLKLAKIDTTRFKPHSTRGASASAARKLGISVNVILRHAGWKKEDSFAKFYNKRIESEEENVGNALLAASI